MTATRSTVVRCQPWPPPSTSSLRRQGVAAMFAAMLLATTVSAADHPLGARRLTVRRDLSTGTGSARWISLEPLGALPAASPFLVGATLALSSGTGDGVTIVLPAGGWTESANRPLYRYVSSTGPVRLIRLHQGRPLKVVTRATLLLNDPSQGSVSARLTVDSDAYCSTCSAPRRDEPGVFIAGQCPSPGTCATTTTTHTPTTSTTTTSLASGVCGNGELDMSEACDPPQGFCPPVPEATCGPPGSIHECQCCFADTCVIDFGVSGPCCDDARCLDTTGAGMVRGGLCVPYACIDAPDCGTVPGSMFAQWECVDGGCCALAGTFCGADMTCCPDTGTTCAPSPVLGGQFVCCLGSGAACSRPHDCCSGSCGVGGTCG